MIPVTATPPPSSADPEAAALPPSVPFATAPVTPVSAVLRETDRLERDFKAFQRRSAVWSVAISAVSVVLTVAGMVVAPITRLSNTVDALREDQKLLAVRVTTLEKKDDAYDTLIQQRNQQLTDMQIREARMEEKLDNLLTRQQR